MIRPRANLDPFVFASSFVLFCSVLFCYARLRMHQLTPAQLEEFESTFRHFDADDTNILNVEEFTAALASLGISYSVG